MIDISPHHTEQSKTVKEARGPLIKSLRGGEQSEGGGGVTVASLK